MFHWPSDSCVPRLASRDLIGVGSAKTLGSGRSRRRAKPCVVESLESRALLSTLTVSSIGDTGPGTLRAAIEQANLDATQDTITFAPSITGTINLSSALPNLSAKTIIDGPGPSVLTIARSDAAGTPAFGIFTVLTGAEVAISGLTIAGGSLPSEGTVGGGIANRGMLSLADLTIVDSSAGTYGGGIYNAGIMSVANSTIRGNALVNYGMGAGIFNDSMGTMSVTNSAISNNSIPGESLGGGNGAGIANSGMMTLNNTTVDGNSIGSGSFAADEAGGILNGATATMSLANSTISGNVVEPGFGNGGTGGGIVNDGTLTAVNTTISNNSADGATGFQSDYPGGTGGGVVNSGSMSIVASTVSGNSAGNGIYIGIKGQVQTPGTGGGIDNLGTLSAVNTTICNNSAGFTNGVAPYLGPGIGGGIANSGTMSIAYSTISGNSVGDGIYEGIPLTIIHGMGGGISSSVPVRLIDTLIAGNSASSGPDFLGAAVSASSHNLIGDGTGLTGISNGTNGNLIGTAASPIDAKLGALSDNGGPTQTIPLLPGSPAINAGVTIRSVVTDQRGLPRSEGSATDIGAFEAQLPPTVLGVQRHGVHLQPTTLVITFSEPMDSARAEALANYRLVAVGPITVLGVGTTEPSESARSSTTSRRTRSHFGPSIDYRCEGFFG